MATAGVSGRRRTILYKKPLAFAVAECNAVPNVVPPPKSFRRMRALPPPRGRASYAPRANTYMNRPLLRSRHNHAVIIRFPPLPPRIDALAPAHLHRASTRKLRGANCLQRCRSLLSPEKVLSALSPRFSLVAPLPGYPSPWLPVSLVAPRRPLPDSQPTESVWSAPAVRSRRAGSAAFFIRRVRQPRRAAA